MSVLLFDVVGELSQIGVNSVKQRLEEWFSSMEKPMGFEIENIDIKVENNIAFCSSFNHVIAKKKDGVALDIGGGKHSAGKK